MQSGIVDKSEGFVSYSNNGAINNLEKYLSDVYGNYLTYPKKNRYRA